jgi:hypothetical protein
VLLGDALESFDESLDFGSGSVDGSGSGSFDETGRGDRGGGGAAMSDRSDWPRVLAERKTTRTSSTSKSKRKVPDEELDPIDAIARASGVQLTIDQSESEDSLDELVSNANVVARAFDRTPPAEASNGMKRELDDARARIRAFEDEVDALRDENARLREALDASNDASGGAVTSPEVVSASADYES